MLKKMVSFGKRKILAQIFYGISILSAHMLSSNATWKKNTNVQKGFCPEMVSVVWCPVGTQEHYCWQNRTCDSLRTDLSLWAQGTPACIPIYTAG